MSMTGRIYSVGSDSRHLAIFDLSGTSDPKERYRTLTHMGAHLLLGTWVAHHSKGELDPNWISDALATRIDDPTGNRLKVLVNVGAVVFKLSITGDPDVTNRPPLMPTIDFTFDREDLPFRSTIARLRSGNALSDALGDAATDEETALAWQVMAPRFAGCTGTGQGVVVGMVDTGVNTNHVEFDGALVVRGPRIDELGATTETTHTGDEHGHGTRMASAVVGRRCGVARDATLFMVAGLDADKSTRLLGLLASIDAAADGPNGTPVDVLSLSLEVAPNALAEATAEDIALLLQNVAAMGSLVLTAAGNHGDEAEGGNECASPLAGLGGSLSVGACDEAGTANTLSGWSVARHVPDLYAYADAVEAPVFDSDSAYSTYYGHSSYATAYTAGVAACIGAREPLVRSEPASLRTRLLALAAPATDPNARPPGSPAGIVRICAAATEPVGGETHDDLPPPPTPQQQQQVSTTRKEDCMTEDTTSAAIGGDPLFDGAEGDNGLWIVWSVDEATGKCASIIGYMWSEEYSAGKLHEYFIFDDNVFNPDYEKLPFVKTLTFWRMSPQPKIASKGEFETWVTTSAPQKIDTPDQVKRFADTAVDSKGWPT